ncbi:MAG TPA: M64 family metallopeptidase [Candidatus Paceibacterota bacterium]|nr:M64 family metallopeptidase [Verrucomicrobiota bacterium]HRY51619.1 M64 family metallopeptidase [Candidatus Paceibacterota bacterium]
MKSRLQKTIRGFGFGSIWGTVVFGAFWAALSATAAIRDPITILGIDLFEDEYRSGGVIQFEVKAPANTMLYLEKTSDLAGGKWDRQIEGVLSAGRAVKMSTIPGSRVRQQFYRIVGTTYLVVPRNVGSGFEFEVKESTPISAVLQSIQKETEAFPYLLNIDDLYGVAAPGIYQGSDLSSVVAKLGVEVWTPMPKEDLSEVAAQLPVNRVFKKVTPIIIPGDEGIGRIEQGWAGDKTLPEPIRIERLPTPGLRNKPLILDVPVAGEIIQKELIQVATSRHLRLSLVTDPLSAQLTRAYEVDDDSLKVLPLRAPEIDTLVYVVKSKLGGRLNDGIYHIGAIPNAWRRDAFDIPIRGAHEVCCMGEERIRISVPLLSRSDISDLTVELYRYEKPVRMDYLTPENFLKNARSFQLLQTLSGDEIKQSIRRLPGLAKANVQPLGSSRSATITPLHTSGSKASKYNIVIMGDGFADTTADQDAFNNYVQNTIMTDLLGNDIHPSILNAINFYRINTYSVNSGVTRVDANGSVTSSKSTSLEYRYSGVWERCWMEPGPNTADRMEDLLDSLCPEADFTMVVLNVNTGGGCRRGTHFAVTLSSSWATVAHEFGHLFGFQGDEYQCNQGGTCQVYDGAEPGADNLTANESNRSTLKWREWVPPTRPIPTTLANVADETQDVGVFPGAMTSMTKYWDGIFRPSWRGRMNNNSPPHNPIGYTAIRDNARTMQEGDFRKNAAGDFNGDGRTDLVLLDGRQLSLYIAGDRNREPIDPVTGGYLRPDGGVLEPTWYHTDLLRNSSGTRSWEFRSADRLLPADFDGDGKTDLYVVNLTSWSIPYVCLLKSYGDHFEPVARYDRELPGWGDMKSHDEFYVGDFSGDGRADLMVFNGQDWDVPYFLLLRSTGSSLAYSHRYDQYLPGWEMGRHEKFHVARFAGGTRAGVVAHNTSDWAQVHLMVFQSTGSQLSITDRYYGEIPGIWAMRRNDQLYPLDFNGDGTTDLAVFNGLDWGPSYLAILKSTAGKLAGVRRYDNGSEAADVAGWGLQRRDRFWAADVDGDNRDDLIVYNSKNWDKEYLGILRSDGSGGLSGSWQKDFVNAWNLGDGDSFRVADFRGGANWADLFVYNQNWFGLLRGYKTRFQLEAIYPKWIYNHRYNAYGWW